VVIYPASGTGAWEAALVNVLGPGDAVLMVETGHCATLWQKMALRLGLAPEFLSLPGTCPDTGLPLAWRHGVSAEMIRERLRKDSSHTIKAVCVVHNETSTGVTSDIAAVRRAIDVGGIILFARLRVCVSVRRELGHRRRVLSCSMNPPMPSRCSGTNREIGFTALSRGA
jgi:aspartate aminotransferase-like enzyme